MSGTNTRGDLVYKGIVWTAASLILVIVAAILVMLLGGAMPTIREFGVGFLVSAEWDPSGGKFGALPFIYGTVVSSLIAIVLSVPVSIGIAVFLTEQAHPRIARPLAFLVELLAAIPSVVYGLWGIFVLAPVVREYIGPFLQTYFGFIPLFQGRLTGIGMFTGGIILSIMITPIITAVIRDVLEAVPVTQREAALALGATKWETTQVVLKNASSGIAGAIVLGLGRAMGETMAVTMVIGNVAQITTELFEPGYTIASVLAANFAEARDPLYFSALLEVGAILFLVTFVVNGIAKLLVSRVTKQEAARA